MFYIYNMRDVFDWEAEVSLIHSEHHEVRLITALEEFYLLLRKGFFSLKGLLVQVKSPGYMLQLFWSFWLEDVDKKLTRCSIRMKFRHFELCRNLSSFVKFLKITSTVCLIFSHLVPLSMKSQTYLPFCTFFSWMDDKTSSKKLNNPVWTHGNLNQLMKVQWSEAKLQNILWQKQTINFHSTRLKLLFSTLHFPECTCLSWHWAVLCSF